MAEEVSNNMKVDPSNIKQTFTEINIKLHCCRYWMLSEWECINMGFPFWRLYHNTIKGASVIFQGVTIQLSPEVVVIIPPYTSFSTVLKGRDNRIVKESIVGRRITTMDEINDLKRMGMIDHLFIHFNLGARFDSVQPGVYPFPVDKPILNLLNEIKESDIFGSDEFGFANSAIIYNLIFSLLIKMGNIKWEYPFLDKRVLFVINYVEKNIHTKLTNEGIASKVNMAINSFGRIFKSNIVMSVQQYILKRRIEKARILIHHNNLNIDEIADECGFYDRHHFSKAFKKSTNISPAYYKRHLTMN